MVYAAILAGGVGRRMQKQTVPKQFVSVGGKPIIIRTLQTFINNSGIHKIYVAVHKDWYGYLKELIAASFGEDILNRVALVCGGKERLDSLVNILEDIDHKGGLCEEDILICHDAVRPFVSQKMIDDCIAVTQKEGFALTVIPTTDTIHTSCDSDRLVGTLDRNGLYNGQTPSGFNILRLKKIIDSSSEEERSRITGTTQLVLLAGETIGIVAGHTSNIKITTDNDLDVAERIAQKDNSRRRIALLDCTLRDGGIVVDFAFGTERMQKIKSVLEASGVEYIECGYINEKTGSVEGRTCFDSERSVEKNFLSTGKKSGIQYVAMIDYGTYDVNALQPRTAEGIDGIRLAFHKENILEALAWGRIILQKGYDLYIQPMVSKRYSDEEFRKLIHLCNTECPQAKAFYIVDSFGQMDGQDLLHLFEIADQQVKADMKIGFHAHNNRQMAYANALTFVACHARHDIMLDASIMGMGKGAGNLCTELIANDLVKEGKPYKTTVLYDSIAEYFDAQRKATPWGYSLDYYLSSLYSCTPSYIKIFKSDARVTTDVLVDLLRTIPQEKKAACDRSFAKEHLANYFS